MAAFDRGDSAAAGRERSPAPRVTAARAAACALAVVALSCGGAAGNAAAPALAPGSCSFEVAEAAASRPIGPKDVRYGVSTSASGDELCAVVDLPGSARRAVAPRGMASYIVEAAALRGGAWQPARSIAELDAACGAARCRVRYKLRVGAAARELDDKDLAMNDRGAFLAPPSSWLVRFQGVDAAARFRAHVVAAPPSRFVTGMFPAKDEPDATEGLFAGLRDTPYAAFGALDVTRVALPGGDLDVAITPGSTGVPRARVVAWVDQSARAIASYFGGFAPHALLVVRAGSGGIGYGNTMGEGGASVLLNVGSGTDERELTSDWVLVHELVHVSFPNVGRPWAEEGLATYVEPLVRARAGLLGRDKVWGDLLDGLPKGQPERGDEGLDHTDTWGRRYWGGAIFWFVGDVEIRRRTNDAKSLDDALVAVARAGGNVGVTWSLEETLRVADAAVGGTTLSDLAKQMKDAPTKANLDTLFADLGVRREHGRVAYDDEAPLAAVRESITAKRR